MLKLGVYEIDFNYFFLKEKIHAVEAVSSGPGSASRQEPNV